MSATLTPADATVDAARRLEITRLVLLLAALFIGLLSASGLLASLLFSRPTDLKYAMTVAVACYLIAVCCVRKPLLVMTATAVAVAPFAATADVLGLPVTLGLLTLVPAVLVLLLSRVTPWQTTEVRRSSLALAVPGMAAALAIPLVLASQPVLWASTILAMLGIGWLVVALARDPRNRRWIAAAAVAGTTLQAGLAAAEFISGKPLNLYNYAASYANYYFRYGNEYEGFSYRPAAGLPDPNSLGNVLALACPLLVALLMTVRTRRLKALVGVAGVVNVVGLAVTLSRMSWISALLGLLVAIAMLPLRKMVTALLLSAAGLAAAVMIALSVSGDALADRFATVAQPTAATTQTRQEDLTRIQLWQASLRVLADHPLIGVGLGELPPYLVASVPDADDASHAHSAYLNVAAEAGIVGGTALLLVIVSALRDCLRGLRRDRLFFAGVLGSLVTVLATWFTDYTVRSMSVGMLVAVVLGLCAAGGRAR